MRQRINISISPQCYQELEQIRKRYRFTNMCEICTALLGVFINKVKTAEAEKLDNKSETDEQTIQRMFNEFANWEPRPNPDVLYRRRNKRDPERVQNGYAPRSATTEANNKDADGIQSGDCQMVCDPYTDDSREPTQHCCCTDDDSTSASSDY